MDKFTDQQIAQWRRYEAVRSRGLFNMYDPRAQQFTGLDSNEYSFVMKHYSELKAQAEQENTY